MEAPGWFPDELAHAGDEHLDPEYVLGYDRKAGADPTEDVALLSDLGLNETHTLVDLGTGTGTLALAAAPLCRRVVAVDVSGAMLTVLKEKTERLVIKNIECVQAGFLTYEHRACRLRLLQERPAPPARLLQSASPRTDRLHTQSGRRAAPPRPRLLLRSARGRTRH
jgi:SAM-dependent methyltransferase